MFGREPSDEVKAIIDDLSKTLEKANRNEKKDLFIKGNEITIKGTNLLNRASTVKMNDTVEGIVLRKYYDKKPRVHIKISYFKVGGKVSKNFKDFSKERKTKYSLSVGLTLTTSIKIKVVESSRFKVTRTIKYINNNDSEITYEKLSDCTNIIERSQQINNLDYLIEQDEKLSSKIKDGLKTLKKWFEDKIQQAKEFINSLKDKIKDKLSKIKNLSKKATINKSISGTKLKKGDTVDKAISELDSELDKVKKETNKIVDSCNKGIKDTIKGDITEAKKEKTKTIDAFKVLKKSTIIIGAILVGVATAGSMFSQSIDGSIADKLQKGTTDWDKDYVEHKEFLDKKYSKSGSRRDYEKDIQGVLDYRNKRVVNSVKNYNKNIVHLKSKEGTAKRKFYDHIINNV